MRSAGTPVLALSLALTAAQAHPGHTMPRRAAAKFAPDADKAAAVADVFNTAWAGYHDHAFPNDTLHPVSNTGENDRNAWGVTPVDALSTAIIMGNKDVVNQILDFVPTIDFTTTQEAESEISVFETNIRYIGGLISAYDLLKGPFKDLVTDEDKVESLLKQVTTLADTLSFAFGTPSGIPDPTVILNPSPRLKGSGNNGIAGCGTLVLEWTRLTDITGNQTYTELTQRAEDHLLNPKGSPEAFPGLVGEGVSLETGEFLDSQGGWNAGTDSFYEYLIKMYLYDPEGFDFYRERWVLAADSTMEHLASHPTTRDDLTFLLQFDGPDKLTPTSGHLASFAGGNFILGGVLLGEQKYIDFGVHLAESYYATYSTAAGIGPEGFDWVDAAIASSGTPPDDQADFYEEQGFWATSPNYILRPETMESLYYAYRATGDAGFQEKGWEAFQRIRDACRAGSGYSGLKDVTKADGGGFDDFMESFFLAETLKYAYLLFAEESEVQFKVDAPNGWVFNTEAHPVRVRA